MDENNDAAGEAMVSPGRENGDPELTLVSSNLFRALWRRRLMVLVMTLVGVGGALVYLARAPQVFTSSAQVYVEQKGPKIITELEGVMTRSKNYLFTQCELIKSPAILRQVVGVDYAPDVEYMDFFAEIARGSENDSLRIDYLRDQLQVNVNSKTDIITISLESTNSTEAAALVNALVDAYKGYHASQKKATTGQVVGLLEQSKEKGLKERDVIYNKLIEFSQGDAESPIAFEDKNGNIILKKLESLSEALTAIQLDLLSAKADYEVVQGMMGSPDEIRQLVNLCKASGHYNSFSNEEIPLRNEMETLQKQWGHLQQKSTMAHPAVQAVRSKMAELQRRLTALENKYARAYCDHLVQRYQIAMQKEAELEETLAQQQKLALEVNTRAVKYARLKSDLSRAEKFCDMLDERIKNINVSQDAGALNINVVEYAIESIMPMKPRRPRVLGFGLFLGLALGALLAIVSDLMDIRLRNANEISAILGVPVLGVVPSMPNKIMANGRRETRSDRGTVVNRKPSSLIAEAYRTIRTAIYYGLPDSEAKIILVTSPDAGDGKTTLVSNLAISMAQAGQKVLIIDGDLRKPDQHQIFNIKSVYGLCDVLEGKMDLARAIRPTRIEGLDILPSGTVVQQGYHKTEDQAAGLRQQAGKAYVDNSYDSKVGPAEMLSSKMFYEMAETLCQQYDRILIDSPPVMYVADARILGAVCDMTLLVLRAEKTTRKATEEARNGLLGVGANVLGAVVNGVPRKKNYYGYCSGEMAYQDSYGTMAGYSRRYGSPNEQDLPADSRYAASDALNPKVQDEQVERPAGCDRVIRTGDIETVEGRPVRRSGEWVDE